MTSTVKTVLIVGASAAGAYLLLKALAPRPASSRRSSYDSLTTPLAFAGLLPGLSSLFSSQSSQSQAPAIVDTPSGFYISAAEAHNVSAYDALGTASNPVYGIAGIDY